MSKKHKCLLTERRSQVWYVCVLTYTDTWSISLKKQGSSNICYNINPEVGPVKQWASSTCCLGKHQDSWSTQQKTFGPLQSCLSYSRVLSTPTDCAGAWPKDKHPVMSRMRYMDESEHTYRKLNAGKTVILGRRKQGVPWLVNAKFQFCNTQLWRRGQEVAQQHACSQSHWADTWKWFRWQICIRHLA